jgi:hypothetical protein
MIAAEENIVAEQSEKHKDPNWKPETKTGDAQGGGDASGAGHILGGVQSEDEDGVDERRDR